ncbi:MAG TPA: hypothetical protein VKA26_05445 [Ignavibacteriaceae bacterium]|nr:hypothetical protein [Ignavibacteriaceae bacterium]
MKFKRILKRWIVTAFVSTVLCVLVYASTQQILRQSANDPQIQMAEDAVNAISKGAEISSVIPVANIDIANSLSPFINIYNSNGDAIAGSGRLYGNLPVPPHGVFKHTKTNGENRLTWQPERGVRIASVILSYSGTNSGFVLAGRSLRETEERESQMLFFSGISLLILLVVSFGLIIGSEYFLREV